MECAANMEEYFLLVVVGGCTFVDCTSGCRLFAIMATKRNAFGTVGPSRGPASDEPC